MLVDRQLLGASMPPPPCPRPQVGRAGSTSFLAYRAQGAGTPWRSPALRVGPPAQDRPLPGGFRSQRKDSFSFFSVF